MRKLGLCGFLTGIMIFAFSAQAGGSKNFTVTLTSSGANPVTVGAVNVCKDLGCSSSTQLSCSGALTAPPMTTVILTCSAGAGGVKGYSYATLSDGMGTSSATTGQPLGVTVNPFSDASLLVEEAGGGGGGNGKK